MDILERTLFDNSPVPTFIIDAETYQLAAASKTGLQLLALAPTQLSSTTFTANIIKNDQPRFLQWLQQNNQSAGTAALFGLQNETGQALIVELFQNPLSLSEGAFYQLVAINVTEKVAAQEALRAERDRFKMYMDLSSEAIWLQELTVPMPIDLPLGQQVEHFKKYSYIAACNDALARMYGYATAAELQGTRSHQLMDFDDPANFDYLKTFKENGYRLIDAESLEKDRFGQDRYFLNNPVGVIENGFLKRVWGTQRDITEKKQIEKKIRLLANLVEQTSDILTATDLDFNITIWNRSAEVVFGLTADQVIGTSLIQYTNITYQNSSREEVKAVLIQHGEWRGEVYFVRPTDGAAKTVLINICLLKDNKGDLQGFIFAGTDITERKAGELKINESEQRFRVVADSAPVGIWMTDADRVLTYINKPLTDYTGMQAGNFAALEWASLIHPDDLAETADNFDQRSIKRLPVTLVYRLKRSSGEYRWVQDIAIPRFLEDGTFIGYIGSVVDINDTKTREEQLRYQATVLENVFDSIITTDLDFKVRSWNKVTEQYFGINEAEAIGKSLGQLMYFDLENSSVSEVEALLIEKGVWQGELAIAAPGNDKKHYATIVKHVYNTAGDAIGFMAVTRDITDRKQAEEKLQQSELFYRSLIGDALDGILLCNAEGAITFVSPSVRRILGYEAGEVMGKNAFYYVHPDDMQWAWNSFQREVTENPEIKFITVRLLKKDGGWLWCMVRGHNLLQNPHVGSIVIYFHDDTMRKQATEALKQSEQKFRHLIDDLQVGVILADGTGKTIMCNKEVTEMFAITEDDLVDKYIYEVLPDDFIWEDGTYVPYDQRPQALAIKTKKVVKNKVMGILRKGSLERIWVLVNADPILDDKGAIQHMICTVNNITERKKLEQKILADQIHHQKLLTQATIDGQEKERKEIGKELHDNIGQQLTTIKLYLDLAKNSADDATLEMISMAIRSVSDVINEVRNITHSLVPPTLGDLGLVESINELVDSIAFTQLLHIDVDHTDFDEDEMPENQKLTLFRIVQEQLNNIVKHADASHIELTLKNNNGMLFLQLTDNGNGFDPQSMRRGLGFINIQNRAELFGGSMQVVSTPGDGCTLKVIIPNKMSYLLQ